MHYVCVREYGTINKFRCALGMTQMVHKTRYQDRLVMLYSFSRIVDIIQTRPCVDGCPHKAVLKSRREEFQCSMLGNSESRLLSHLLLSVSLKITI